MNKTGGLIPDPGHGLGRRIDKLEARLAELETHTDVLGKEISLIQREMEKGKAESETEPKQWKPYPIYYSFESIFSHPQAQWMEEKITKYANQLQWLFIHYPEQNGEWTGKTASYVSYNKRNDRQEVNTDVMQMDLNKIYMSHEAAEHLRRDMDSGKVRF